jgi:hypothetical protein
MNLGELNITVRLANPRAVKAFGLVLRTLGELADRYPYDIDLRIAVRAGRYALKNLKPETKETRP